jgi:hypothetical protein
MDFKKLYEQFKADFPTEAYAKDNSRGFELTTLKAQYIVERLNTVVGVNGWGIVGEFIEKDSQGVLFLGQLNIFTTNKEGETVVAHSVEAIGFSSNTKNIGDAYKGARTDALSKAASYLGIGNEMFKGNISPSEAKTVTKKPTKKAAVVIEDTKDVELTTSRTFNKSRFTR